MTSLTRQIRTFLKQIDLFSIPVPVLTTDAKSQYSSSYSGLISIIASVLSIAYFVYVIQEWANGNIPPTITTNQQAQAYSEQVLEDNFIQFRSNDPSNHDPFKRKNNIITPLLFTVENYKIITAPTPLFSDENQPFTVGLKKGTLVVNNLNDQIDDQSYKPSKNYLLIFIECLDQYLDENSNCASQEEIDQYMSEYHGFLAIIMKLEQYNYKKDQKEYIIKQAFQALSPAYIQYTQISIQQKEINIDNGLLFENQINHNLINDFQIINQSIDNQYIQNIASSFSTQKFELNAIFAYQISIDNLQISERIIQPKLSAVLAYIGSIVQQSSQITSSLKKRCKLKFFKCIGLVLEKLIEIIYICLTEQSFVQELYYPKLKNVKVKRNALGKIISTNQGNEDNPNAQFIKQYQDHLDLAFKKLRLINIIYELSRIELLLEKHFGLQNICECSQLGSEFQFLGHDNKNESPKASILSVGNQSPQPKEDIFTLFNKS